MVGIGWPESQEIRKEETQWDSKSLHLEISHIYQQTKKEGKQWKKEN